MRAPAAPLICSISTHAPLAGRDSKPSMVRDKDAYFNPRAPCGARQFLPAYPTSNVPFQPTRPLRGATARKSEKLRWHKYFNPRAPCGARHIRNFRTLDASRDFNPRAPCGARRIRPAAPSARRYFNPRAPCGARHLRNVPHERRRHFNPRAPCGARPSSAKFPLSHSEFQPTRPLRGATAKVYKSLCTFLR